MGTNETNSTNKKMRMAANKIQSFFCHSSGRWNPVAVVAALIFLFGAFVPQSASAIFCFNNSTGVWYESDTDTCPYGSTDDPGRVNDDTNDDTSYDADYLREIDAQGTGGNAGSGKITTFGGLIAQLNKLLNTVVPFLVGLAVLIIIWELVRYVYQAGDEEKRLEAKKFVVWGVVFIFLMLSIWGLVNILDNSFSFQKTPVHVESIFPTRN